VAFTGAVHDQIFVRHDVEDLSVLAHEVGELPLQVLALPVENVLQGMIAVVVVEPEFEGHIEAEEITPQIDRKKWLIGRAIGGQNMPMRSQSRAVA